MPGESLWIMAMAGAGIIPNPDSLAEEALAHINTSQRVAAYRRRDQLERRRLMMEDWGAYCAGNNLHGASIRSAIPQTFAA
jgi:hypothetical protein